MLDLFPIRPRSKVPRDSGWQTNPYTPEQLSEWRGNLGVRIAPGQAVLDIDPRNDAQGRNALQILNAFQERFDVDLRDAHRVLTGGGGYHVYLSLPPDVKLREKLEGAEWKAVELKQHGKYVLAPGSIHPDTGREYETEQFGPFVELPEHVRAAFAAGPRERSSEPGEVISAEHLRSLLSHLDVLQYQDRSEWIKVLLEAHSATGGSPEGFEVFAEWSAQDETFAGDVDKWQYQWELARGDRPGDRTVASLIRRVQEAGGNPNPPAADQYPDDLPEPPAPLLGRRPQSLAPYDPEFLETRPWLVEGMLLDGTVTLLVAKGGSGKSLFCVHLAAMCALGIPWAHWRPSKAGRVLLLNAEDDRNEVLRRLTVIARTMEIPTDALAGRIDAYCRGELPDFTLVRRTGGQFGEIQRTELFKHLKELIVEGNYGLVIIDPLIKVHAGLDENSNDDMELVAQTLGALAENPAVSLMAVHHASKGGAGRGQDASRGGGSIVAAARNLLNLEPMDEKEAEYMLPADERRWFRRYVKVIGDKHNYNESQGTSWLQFAGDFVQNGPDGGDRAAALVPWSPHEPLEVTPEQVDKVLDEVMRRSRLGGERYYRPECRGNKETRADIMIADVLGVTERQGRGLLMQLMQQGRLVDQVSDKGGKSSKRLVVGDEDGSRLAPTQSAVEEDE